MKFKNAFFIFALSLGFSLNSQSSNSQLSIFDADFSSINRDSVYTVNCGIGIATIIELPNGKQIKEFILGDPDSWKWGCDGGTFGLISPKRVGIRTSLTIITTDNDVYSFLVVQSSNNIIGKIRILNYPKSSFFASPAPAVQAEEGPAVEKNAAAAKEGSGEFEEIEARIKVKRAYRIKSNKFEIEHVIDDGIFTYILLKNAQVRPAIFLNANSELEPQRYFDKGDYYVIHRILARGERFILKLGDLETTIKLK